MESFMCVFGGDTKSDPRSYLPLNLENTNINAQILQDGSFSWLHLSGHRPELTTELKSIGTDQMVIEALLASETRPRCTTFLDGVLLNLRGVNLNPGAEAEDMVSIRLWVTHDMVVSVWLRPLLAISDIMQEIRQGRVPVSPANLVAKMALRLADRAEPTVANLNEQLDGLEDASEQGVAASESRRLANIRRSAIIFRRYMFPQRDALTTLEIEDFAWIKDRDRNHIREAAERVTRLSEELDAIRDRAQIVHDEIVAERAELMNRQMLVLSVVAAIFLPLGFITGLLGINVGGMPGAQTDWAFVFVCAMLSILAAVLVVLFARLGLFKKT